jgi:hypothetical protein
LCLGSLPSQRQLPAFCQEPSIQRPQEEQREANTLPLITLTSTKNSYQAEATRLLRQVATGEIKTSLYPIYKARELYSETRPPQLWSKQDRQNVKGMTTSSEALKILFQYQLNKFDYNCVSASEQSSSIDARNKQTRHYHR